MSAQSDSVNGVVADTTNTTAAGASDAPSSSTSTYACWGNRSLSASIMLVVPASHGPATSTTSRLSTPGELRPGSIAVSTASASAIGSVLSPLLACVLSAVTGTVRAGVVNRGRCPQNSFGEEH